MAPFRRKSTKINPLEPQYTVSMTFLAEGCILANLDVSSHYSVFWSLYRIHPLLLILQEKCLCLVYFAIKDDCKC